MTTQNFFKFFQVNPISNVDVAVFIRFLQQIKLEKLLSKVPDSREQSKISYSNYSLLHFPGNCYQIESGASSSVSVKEKAEESEEDKKTASLAELRFNGSENEGLFPSNQRKIVARSQKGKEIIDEAQETLKQEKSKTIEDLQEESTYQKEAGSDEEIMPFHSSNELWEHLNGCLSEMSSQSSFCFQGGLQVKKISFKSY